jgi:hypothetical protein
MTIVLITLAGRTKKRPFPYDLNTLANRATGKLCLAQQLARVTVSRLEKLAF